MKASPLTGVELASQPSYQEFAYYYEEPPIGRYALTEHLWRRGFHWDGKLDITNLQLDKRQTNRLLALATSKVREAQLYGTKNPIFMTEDGRSNISSRGEIKNDHYFAWRVWTIESLWQEIQSLDLKAKAMRTLVNLTELEPGVGEGIAMLIPMRPDVVRSPGWGRPIHDFAGIAYGCTPPEIHVVMAFLEEEGLVSAEQHALYIKPKGYLLASSLSQNQITTSQTSFNAFLICRFTPGQDSIFDAVYSRVVLTQNKTVAISRVKDIHHIDRIDDKIMSEIRQSPIIVVDLSDQNFNVAFEAGYALALNKPIVWTMLRPEGDIKLPFDIQSHNILLYDLEDLESFRGQLGFRIQVAIEKAMELANVKK